MGAEVSWRVSGTITLDFSKDKSHLSSSKIKTIQRRRVCHNNWHLKLLSEKGSFRIQLAEHEENYIHSDNSSNIRTNCIRVQISKLTLPADSGSPIKKQKVNFDYFSLLEDPLKDILELSHHTLSQNQPSPICF